MIVGQTGAVDLAAGIAAMLNKHGGDDPDVIWEVDPLQKDWIAKEERRYIRPRSIVPKGVSRHDDLYEKAGTGYDRPDYGIVMRLDGWGKNQRVLFFIHLPHARHGSPRWGWPGPTNPNGTYMEVPKSSAKVSRGPEDIAKFLLRGLIPKMNVYHAAYCEAADKAKRHEELMLVAAHDLRQVNGQPLSAVGYDHRASREKSGTIDAKLVMDGKQKGRQTIGQFYMQSPTLVRLDISLPRREAEVVLRFLSGLDVGRITNVQ